MKTAALRENFIDVFAVSVGISRIVGALITESMAESTESLMV